MRIDPKSGNAQTMTAPDGLHSVVPASDIPMTERDPTESSLLGTVIDGRYFIERVIGEGGMGIVYLARHRAIDKRVAVKVLRREMARDTEMTERFVQEARTASSIGNAHIVDIADFGVLPEGWTYFVMEYLDGASLGGFLEVAIETKERMPVTRAVHIAKQIAQGLAAAHAVGIVHRDLKPDNVMLIEHGSDSDFVKILDFGIAKVASQANKITRAGSIFGTPHYMSPEQASGTTVDARTDIYALGVILYEMLAGVVPFDAEAVMTVLTQHLYKAAPILSAASARADVTPAIDAVVAKCLAKAPDDRYDSMEALLRDLEAVERGESPVALVEGVRLSAPSASFEPPTGTSGVALSPASPESLRTTKRSSRLALAAGAALLLVGTGVFALTRRTAAPPTADVSNAAHPPVVSAPASSLATLAAPPVEKLLLLSIDPLDAKAMRDGVDLGQSPIALRLKPDERATVIVTRAGYTQLMEVFDATDLPTAESRRLIHLTPAAKPHAAPRPNSRPKISEHEDPWKKSL